jgi:hypothetical protein
MGKEVCGILTWDPHITRFSEVPLGCLRPEGHRGPHLIQLHDRSYVAYETDLLCDCYGCRSDNPDEWCEIFWTVTAKKARKLKCSLKEKG